MTSKATVTALFADDQVITENSNEARELFNQSRFGSLLEDGRVRLSFLETFYLIEKQKINLVNSRGKETLKEVFLKRAKRVEPRFWIRYCIFKNIRDRGYIIKTALKFGADFRVYDRGVKPGEDHAKWVIFPVSEGETFTWHEFAAKNRVAHSTKKKLLIGVVDDESDVSYWECRWLRP
ncbi:tRNA-intron lyase [Candidatus Woesearchaeota archaeon]|nr:tRNA-intron lyase [Candidatus Woesearchaeota archaeon]